MVLDEDELSASRFRHAWVHGKRSLSERDDKQTHRTLLIQHTILLISYETFWGTVFIFSGGIYWESLQCIHATNGLHSSKMTALK